MVKFATNAILVILGVSALSSVTAHAQSRFDGAYFGAFGGYSFEAQKPSDTFASFDSLSGAFVGGLAGYNVTTGRLLLGFELRGRKDFQKESVNVQSASTISFPAFIPTGCCFGPPPPLPATVTLGSAFSQDTSVERNYSGDLSLRAGIMLSPDILFFGRAGLGFTQLSSSFISRSGNVVCTEPVINRITSGTPPFQIFNDLLVGCNARSTNLVVTSFNKTTSYAPYVTLGIGTEVNIGQYFLRLEGEFADVIPTRSNGGFYFPSASAAVGFRF